MLIPDPCFLPLLERGTGPRRMRVRVSNPGEALSLHVTAVVKPEWLEIEDAHPGETLLFSGRGAAILVLNINTDHRFFPATATASISEQIALEFVGHPPLHLHLHVQALREPQAFRGVFALDFGTTNTCWAWKPRAGDRVTMSDLVRPPQASRTHPSVIHFRDLSVQSAPLADVGFPARDAIVRAPSSGPTWVVSVKRLLGSSQPMTVADNRAGTEPGHYLRLQPYEVAGIMIREFVREAEAELGQRIDRIAATYPVMFSRGRIEHLRLAFHAAFKGLNRPLTEDALVLAMDETNAAAFAFVHNHLLEDFKRTTAASAAHRLLAIDIGGGTTDVAVLDVDLARDAQGRIAMHTAVAGVTGEPAWGGDNATLAMVLLLRARLALRIATLCAAPVTTAMRDTVVAARPGSDDPFAALAAELATRQEVGPSTQVDDPLTRGLAVAAADPLRRARFADACRLLLDHAAVIERACALGMDLAAAVAECGSASSWHQGRELHEALDEALDTVIPTRWQAVGPDEPELADTARALFHELWYPAETVKIRLSMGDATTADQTEPLPRIAFHAGVSTEGLSGVRVARSELEAAIGPRLRRIIARAAYVVDQVSPGAEVGMGLAVGPAVPRSLTVVLAGNGSRPPLVRRLVEERCGVPAHAVVTDPQPKTVVARGACAERALATDFGGAEGLISFSAKPAHHVLPYTIGLFHPQLTMQGFPGGFVPLIARHSPVGSEVVLTRAIPVLHPGATELMLFAYYHDHDLGAERGTRGELEGVEPATLGWFDLLRPEQRRWSHPFCEATTQQLAALDPADLPMVLHLDEQRVPVLVRPSDRVCFVLRGGDESPLGDDPFSGRW